MRIASRPTLYTFLIVNGAIVAMYGLLSLLSNLFLIPVLNMPFIWLPAGLGAAIMLARGIRKTALGIWIGAFLPLFVNSLHYGIQLMDLVLASMLATGALLQALVISLLHHRLGLFSLRLTRGEHFNPGALFKLIAVGGLACLIETSVEALTWAISGEIPVLIYPLLYLVVWLGNLCGLILLAPPIIWSVAYTATWSISRQIGIFVIDLGFILATMLFGILWHVETEHIKQEFDSYAQTAALVLRNRINYYLHDMQVMQAFFLASEQGVTRNEFDAFSQRQIEYPVNLSGRQVLIWAPVVAGSERAMFEAAARSEGLLDFQITEALPDGRIQTAAARSEYVVATFVVPVAQHRDIFGFDMNSDPTWQAMLAQARDSAQVVATEPIELFADQTPGFLLASPIYRGLTVPPTLAIRQKNIQGYVIGMFSIEDLIVPVMQIPNLTQIDLFLFAQGSSATDDRPFYTYLTMQSISSSRFATVQRGLHYTTNFDMAGQTWQLVIRPNACFVSDRRAWLPWLAFIAGLTLSLWMARVMIKRQEDAESLRKSEQRFRTILQTAQDGFLLIGLNQRIIDVNSAYCTMSGYNREQLLGGMHIFDLEMIDTPKKLMARIEQIKAAGMALFETRHRRIDGSILNVEISIHYIDSDGGQMVCFCRDIAERKRREDEIRQLNSELERRVVERTADLSRANADLNRALRTKDEFLATMSHELRTPLNSILSFSELLLEQLSGPLNEYQIRSLNHIDTSGHHLLSLINDILDLSKIEAGRMDIYLDIYSVVDICEASLLFIKEIATKKGLQVSFICDDRLLMMEMDVKRLKQMLVNLLSNAVKFTPEGGHITFSVTTDPLQEVIYFAVEDTGIGIAPEDMGRLFQPFTQLDSSLSRQHEGTGLGLALVQRIVDLLGGSVYVESPGVGQGSRFTLSLPWHRASTQPIGTHPPLISRDTNPLDTRTMMNTNNKAHSTDRGSVTILLAEDNETTISVLTDFLVAQKYQVVVARNGMEALNRVAESLPDIILMDIQMPVMDGLTAIKELRTQPVMAMLPIIALTALAMQGDRERCLAAGANEYMSKPVSLRQLAELIEVLLRGGHE